MIQLMPWMIKNRVFSDKRLESLSLDHYNARRIERISTSSTTTLLVPVKTPPSPKRSSYLEQTKSLLGELEEESVEEELPFHT